MSRNKTNKAQCRGQRRRITLGNKDNLDQQIDRIAASLGVSQRPAEDPPPTTPQDDLLLGVPVEIWLGLGVLATVGIVHWF